MPARLRVLTLSTLFPDASRPHLAPFVLRQTQELAKLDGLEVKLVAPRGIPPFPLRHHPHYRRLARVPMRETWEGLDVFRPAFRHWPLTNGRFDVAALIRALHPLLKKIRSEFPFDVIDAQYFFPDGPAATALGARFGVPVSIKARGGDIHFWGVRAPSASQIQAAAAQAGGLLAVSEDLRQDMIALGLEGAKIRVHHTGVDLDRFILRDKAATKASLGVSAPLILCLGALIPRKRTALVLAALRHLPNAQLVLIGDGPDATRLQRLAVQLGVAPRVQFLGARPQSDIALWLAAADVMALPSRSEGLANAWLEALACGTPIVITDAGGAHEVLRNDAVGRIAPPSASAIARAISDLLADPPNPKLCRAVAARFTWAKNAQALRDHLLFLIRK